MFYPWKMHGVKNRLMNNHCSIWKTSNAASHRDVWVHGCTLRLHGAHRCALSARMSLYIVVCSYYCRSLCMQAHLLLRDNNTEKTYTCLWTAIGIWNCCLISMLCCSRVCLVCIYEQVWSGVGSVYHCSWQQQQLLKKCSLRIFKVSKEQFYYSNLMYIIIITVMQFQQLQPISQLGSSVLQYTNTTNTEETPITQDI